MEYPQFAIVGFVLLGVGALLLAGELCFPSGFLLVVALGVVVVGVGMTFFAGPAVGLITMFAVALGFPLAATLFFRLGPKTPGVRRFFLTPAREQDNVTAMPVLQELEKLRGRYGQTLSDLRPAGVVDFDGRRTDALTEGMMVARGQWVRCVDVRAGKVIVRPAEKPDLGGLEAPLFE
jgi:membrane-bound serine protease (ClpP class)